VAESPKSSKRGRPKGAAGFAWRGFFQQSRTPVFVLGKGKRLRFANAAWEQLTGHKLADELGLVCTDRANSSMLAKMLAPSPEAMAGKADRVRRHAPNHRTGPPWWDITFVPLPGPEDSLGIVGFIEVSGEGSPAASRKVSASAMAIREMHMDRFAIDRLGGKSVPSQRLASQLRLAAATTAPVWLVGEPGSGKESAARAIHRASPNRDRSFVAIDCTGLQPYLIESLLWGHGGLAGSDRIGAVYLKEPSTLPRDLQQKFLEQFGDARFPRLMCGSTRSAIVDVKAKTLLPEFHTKFSALEVRVPAFKERLDELSRFLGEHRVEPAAMSVLAAHSWPGNLRELRTVLEAASQSAAGAPIQREHIPRELKERLGIAKPPPDADTPLDASLEELERKLIVRALAKTEGNVTKAAEKLGVQRNRLLRRIEALGISNHA
jgi:transcriptional regulator with PAS, ATPase and Fis domain